MQSSSAINSNKSNACLSAGAQPAATPDIKREYFRLASQVEYLESLVGNLIPRLEPVLVPRPAPEAVGGAIEESPKTLLGGELRSLTIRLDYVRHELNSALDRLEI